MGKLRTYHIAILIATVLLMIGFLVYYIIDTKAVSVTTPTPSDVGSDFANMIDTNSSEINIDKPTSNDSTSTVDPNLPKANHFSDDEINLLNEMMIRAGEGVSVYFEDINSGNIYTYNDEEKYFIASVIKAPYCMYLYDLASQGKANLDDKFTFTSKDIKEGTGKLKDMKFEIDEVTEQEIPIELTMRELISYALIESDNTAMELLRKKYNYDGYTTYAMGLGLNFKEDIAHIVDGKLTAKDAGIYAKAIYNFFSDNMYGAELKSDMEKTRNPMIISKYPMARKYGWAPEAFHDMAIVYPENPYVLVILSNRDKGEKDDFEIFREISQTLEKMQLEKYKNIEL